MEDIIELKEENIDFGKLYYVIKDAFYKPNYDKVKIELMKYSAIIVQ